MVTLVLVPRLACSAGDHVARPSRALPRGMPSNPVDEPSQRTVSERTTARSSGIRAPTGPITSLLSSGPRNLALIDMCHSSTS
jgi:hypothetical protein